ncbi:MAG: transposase [Magnetococcales bacterium]|nr:transposase [Magnetococcales bacterium]
MERWHGTIKSECIRPQTPLTLEDAQRIVGQYVEHYNTVRLHSAIGYVTPADRLAGRHTEIEEARKQKLEEARANRIQRRNLARTGAATVLEVSTETV